MLDRDTTIVFLVFAALFFALITGLHLAYGLKVMDGGPYLLLAICGLGFTVLMSAMAWDLVKKK